MALTKWEVVQVLGRTVEKVGKEFDTDDPDSPNELTKEEILQIVQETIADLLAEFQD